MKPSGAHTHPDSGGSLLLAALAVIDALARLAEVFVITLGAVIGLAVIATAAVAVTRAPQGRAIVPARVIPPRPVPWQRTQPLTTRPRPAVEAPRPEVHLHFHGASAEDVAEALRQLPDAPL